MIKNLNIRTKLWILGFVSILGLLSIAAESFSATRKINQASTDISQIWLPSVIIAEELNTILSDYRLKENEYLQSDEPAQRLLLKNEMETLVESAEQRFDQYDKIVNGNQLLAETREIWNQYITNSSAVLDQSRDEYPDDQKEALQTSQDLFDAASKSFLNMAAANKRGAQEASDFGDQLYQKLTRIKAFTIVFISAIIIFLILWIIRLIDEPIEQVVDALRRAANGDLNIEIEYQSKDEMGLLTKSVNGLLKRMRMIIEDEKYLFREIGNENFNVKSSCEQAYQGDFAPVLYAFTSLKYRLSESKQRQQSKIQEKREEQNGENTVDGICEER